VKPGDEVRVFRKGRDYGEGEPGEVTRAGRTLVTIRWRAQEGKFGALDGILRDRYGETFFLTADECALRAIGLSFRPYTLRANLTAGQIRALADVARSCPAPAPIPEMPARRRFFCTYPVME